MALPLQVWAIILVALVFDFTNGFHDAANSIATVVSTRVLSPKLAVLWAAFFNFVAFLAFGVHVARPPRHGGAGPRAAGWGGVSPSCCRWRGSSVARGPRGWTAHSAGSSCSRPPRTASAMAAT